MWQEKQPASGSLSKRLSWQCKCEVALSIVRWLPPVALVEVFELPIAAQNLNNNQVLILKSDRNKNLKIVLVSPSQKTKCT